MLIYAFGSGKGIAEGEIRWQPNADGDRAHQFRVVRSSDPQRFQFDSEEPIDLDDVAERIVREFLTESDRA